MTSIHKHRNRFLLATCASALLATSTPALLAESTFSLSEPAVSVIAPSSRPSELAADDGKDVKEVKEVKAPESSPLFNVLFNLEIADKYVTPRGMIVHNDGVTFQPLLLIFLNAYKGQGFINSVTLFGGTWWDFTTDPVSRHAPYGSPDKTGWTEMDPIGGIEFGFAKNFKLDVTYTSFYERIEDIETSHHLETKLSFDDSDYLKAFALHPYVSYWQELQGKATDADVPYKVFGPSAASGSHPEPNSSFYFDIGIDPSYTFHNLWDFKIEAPCRLLVSDNRFYGEYYKSSSTLGIGLYELGLKGSIPLKFIPASAGHWSIHAGFKYMNFVDDNLYNLNEFNAPNQPVRDTWQAYGGITVFF